MSAAQWLASEVEQIDALYPITVPEGMTVRCIPRTSMGYVTSWAIEIAMANDTRQATCYLNASERGCYWNFHPRAVRPKPSRARKGDHVKLDLPFYANPQQIVDAVAAWVCDTGQLNLGATA